MPRSKQAIADDLARRLGAPFDDVRFEWDISDSHVTLEYIGAPNRLLECGAIEPDMAGKSKVKSRPRVDSAGNYYHRELRIDPHSMTNYLKVTRYITDPKFAETLPGGPRGLRFKRLDWLDAHPASVHVVTEKSRLGNQSWVRTRTAGTLDGLLAAGFSKDLFKVKFSPSTWRQFMVGGTETEPKGAYKTVHRLMRGYYEIEMDMPREVASTSLPIKPQAKAGIRLVWTNPEEAP
jgi:hypothetical protein